MIHTKHLSKKFLIPHKKRVSFRDYFIDLFSSTNYREFDALSDISFDVYNGEWLGIIGKNGSGKSTLLKVLAGIYLSDSGEIKIDGNVVPFLELGVGFEPELSARDNIYLNGLLLGIPHQTIKEKFEEILQFAEVGEFVDQKLKNFSSGMKIRLAFAIAMHTHADVFVIDEVLSVGDYSFQQKSLAVLKSKFKDKIVIYVSHDLTQIAEVCTRVMWLDGGKIVKIGKPQEVVDSYINLVKK